MSSESRPTAEALKTYVDANAGTYTDEAITAELIQAGYAPDDIRAALQDATARGVGIPPTRRAIATIAIAYGITFALLSVGMLASNGGRGSGSYLPDAIGGILILAGTLGVALIFSLLWVGNRRASGLILAALLGLVGVSVIATGGINGFLFIALAIGLVLLVARSKPRASHRSTATLGVLLSVPVLLLVVVAGICVASGMPIPRPG